MLKASITLGLLGLFLLMASFAPLPGDARLNSASPEGAPALQAELAAEGHTLFLAKGCATCHRHADVGPQAALIEVGPTLTHYEPDKAFVRRWLSDPQAVRPTTFMPNLELSDEEIEALIAFLSAP
jgi:cytochrome c1